MTPADLLTGWRAYQPGVVIDPFLERMVAVGDALAATTLPLTLVTAGAVVTGTLMSAAAWVRVYGKDMTMVTQSDIASSAQIIASYGDMAEKMIELARDPAYRPAFLHLINARIVVGARMLPNSVGKMMRIRLTDVSGWFLGEVPT